MPRPAAAGGPAPRSPRRRLGSPGSPASATPVTCPGTVRAPPGPAGGRSRRRPSEVAKVVIGSPATVVSGNRTVRAIAVWNTFSSNASTSRASTSRLWTVRESNIVATRPSISRPGLSRSCTFWIVSTSMATPRRAKNSASIGTITPSAAVSALTVSRPSDGWQSMITKSYSATAGRQRAAEDLLAGDLGDQLHLGGRQVDVARDDVQPGHVGLEHDVVQRDVPVHDQVVDALVDVVGVDAQPDRQRALRVEVDQQHLAAVLGQRGTQVDRRRGLADAALLVAHGDDPGGARAAPWAAAPGSAASDARSAPSAGSRWGRRPGPVRPRPPGSRAARPGCAGPRAPGPRAGRPRPAGLRWARRGASAVGCSRCRPRLSTRRPVAVPTSRPTVGSGERRDHAATPRTCTWSAGPNGKGRDGWTPGAYAGGHGGAA